MKYYLYPFILLLPCFALPAQQSTIINQAADEFGYANSAGLSMEEMRFRGTLVNVFVRNQWWSANTPGSPRTQMVSWLDNTSQRHQYGAYFISDKIGETYQAGITGRYAHTIAEGLRVGITGGMTSNRIFVENLDQYDEGDPLAARAGESRWKLISGAGIFYTSYRPNTAFNWFAGLSFNYRTFLSSWPESEAVSETDLLAQGGVGWNSWWAGGRIRASNELPSALDLYLRKYVFEKGKVNNYFAGGLFTSDGNLQTAGVQLGYERQLRSGGLWNNHYLIVSFSFSRSFSKYSFGDQLIFDAKATWAWERKPKN